VAYWAKKNRPEYSVLWVPALSNATFEQACMEIAKALGIRRADDEDIRDAVRQYLSSNKAGHWLLVVDNADDKDVLFGHDDACCGIIGHLPYSEQGLILFTTRFEEIAEEVAGSDVIELGDMDQQEATGLLERHLRRKEQLVSDKARTAELLRELTYLPLAITQAAAYINRNHISISEYLQLLRGTEQDIIGVISREFQDSSRYRGAGNAVATTWLVSFDQIRRSDAAACNLLMFISHIEPKAIPRSLLPRTGSEEDIVHAIGTLCAYSFLIRRREGLVYDMHSLVHLATQIWMGKHGLVEEAIEKAVRHVAEVFPSNAYENRYLWRQYMPHALKLAQGNSKCNIGEQYDLYFWAGRCLHADGRIGEAVECLENCWLWRREHFPEDDPSRLASELCLALAYRDNGQVAKAVTLLEKVLEIRGKTLNETHPDRLASEHCLALAYRDNGQVAKAVTLLEKVVEIRGKTLNETHPDRLASEHCLALAYQNNGQVAKAVTMLEKVVEIQTKTLDETHPDRLASEHCLALAYRDNGQAAKAVARSLAL
jgi:tetratricopeptide (TPR) repeat protein